MCQLMIKFDLDEPNILLLSDGSCDGLSPMTIFVSNAIGLDNDLVLPLMQLYDVICVGNLSELTIVGCKFYDFL